MSLRKKTRRGSSTFQTKKYRGFFVSVQKDLAPKGKWKFFVYNNTEAGKASGYVFANAKDAFASAKTWIDRTRGGSAHESPRRRRPRKSNPLPATVRKHPLAWLLGLGALFGAIMWYRQQHAAPQLPPASNPPSA